MRRTVSLAAAGLTAAALAIGGTVTADASAPSSKLDKSDVAFLRSNDQVNLAELALGAYVVHHAKDKHARQLARVTRHDHHAAEHRLRSLAHSVKVSLPTTPDAAQQKTLAGLKKVTHIDYTYFEDQIAGHEQSIAATKHELKYGRDAAVKAYARYYLPIAEKHLAMSRADLAYYRAHHHKH